MESEPAKKRKTHIVRAIIIGAVFLGSLFAISILRSAEGVNSGNYRQISFSKRSYICFECGALMQSKSLYILGQEIEKISPVSAPFFPQLGAIPCDHKQLQSVGWWNLDVYPFDCSKSERGDPTGNFFSSAPALTEVLSSIANTNAEGAQVVLRALAKLRFNRNNLITNVLPALPSRDSALLKSQILSRPFFEAVSSTLTNWEFATNWQKFESQNSFQP
jgi:hypothetical protein